MDHVNRAALQLSVRAIAAKIFAIDVTQAIYDRMARSGEFSNILNDMAVTNSRRAENRAALVDCLRLMQAMNARYIQYGIDDTNIGCYVCEFPSAGMYLADVSMEEASPDGQFYPFVLRAILPVDTDRSFFLALSAPVAAGRFRDHLLTTHSDPIHTMKPYSEAALGYSEHWGVSAEGMKRLRKWEPNVDARLTEVNRAMAARDDGRQSGQVRFFNLVKFAMFDPDARAATTIE